MPRLSLYRPEKTQDYKFIDRTIYEMFQVGGVDVFVHKFVGTVDGKDHTQIQDLLFLENRDRKYDQDVFVLRGHFQTQDVDFNLSQFGLFLQNDTVFLTIHINNSVDLLGRKIISGDVVELPNLKDEYALNDYSAALKRFYVVEDVNRAAEGFSATWYPHLYRIKLKPIVDSQEYKDILDRPLDSDVYAGDYDPTKTYYTGQVVKYLGDLYEVKGLPSVDANGTTLSPPDPAAWQPYSDTTVKDLMSTYEKEMQINAAVIAEADADAPASGYETSHFFTLAVDPNTGKAAINTVDPDSLNVAGSFNVSNVNPEPVRSGYKGYLLDDGIPPNGLSANSSQYGFGLQFPSGAISGDLFLRTDYLPNRLFRFDGARWVKMEDKVRMTFGGSFAELDTRQTQKTSFINNSEMSGINKVGSDVVRVDLLGNPIFEAGTLTSDFELTANDATVITTLDYNASYIAEVWIDENARATSVVPQDVSGKFSFKINHQINDGTRIRYTVFDTVVEQRQSLSKALRIKPTAD